MFDSVIVQANKHPSSMVISCLEHEHLSVTDFTYAEDFEYLIHQELPCFKIEVKRGRLILAVTHYLASILLPSGTHLEILPKVSVSAGEGQKRDDAIIESRKWVAQMLSDIASDNLQQILSAMTMRAGGSQSPSTLTPELEQLTFPHSAFQSMKANPPSLLDKAHFNNASIDHDTPDTASSKDKAISKQDLDNPWYLGILNTAEKRLLTAIKDLPNRYQTHVQNSPKAQGKLKLKSQLKVNWHRPHYQYKEHSVFELDAKLAQFLVTGWRQLQKLKAQQTGVHLTQSSTQIGAYSQASQTVSYLQTLADLLPNQYEPTYRQLKRDSSRWRSQLTPRQYQLLMDAIDWSWWLLNHLSDTSSSSGESSSGHRMPQPALMINMNHAFERWVIGKLAIDITRHLPDSHLLIQPKLDWLINKRGSDDSGSKPSIIQQLIPDVCIRNAEEDITHVIDIKYKVLTRVQEVSGADWQQLSAYQSYLNCENAWLIYPMTKSFKERLDVCINLDENRRPNQQDSIEMSVLPFNLIKGKLLIK